MSVEDRNTVVVRADWGKDLHPGQGNGAAWGAAWGAAGAAAEAAKDSSIESTAQDTIKGLRDDVEDAHMHLQPSSMMHHGLGTSHDDFNRAYASLYAANHASSPEKAARHLSEAAGHLRRAATGGFGDSKVNATAQNLAERAAILAQRHQPAAGTPGWV